MKYYTKKEQAGIISKPKRISKWICGGLGVRKTCFCSLTREERRLPDKTKKGCSSSSLVPVVERWGWAQNVRVSDLKPFIISHISYLVQRHWRNTYLAGRPAKQCADGDSFQATSWTPNENNPDTPVSRGFSPSIHYVLVIDSPRRAPQELGCIRGLVA